MCSTRRHKSPWHTQTHTHTHKNNTYLSRLPTCLHFPQHWASQNILMNLYLRHTCAHKCTEGESLQPWIIIVHFNAGTLSACVYMLFHTLHIHQGVCVNCTDAHKHITQALTHRGEGDNVVPQRKQNCTLSDRGATDKTLKEKHRRTDGQTVRQIDR